MADYVEKHSMEDGKLLPHDPPDGKYWLDDLDTRLARFALVLAGLVCVITPYRHAAAQPAPAHAREIPTRTIPVPDTVSPRMQAIIAQAPVPFVAPTTAAEWKSRVEKMGAGVVAGLRKIREASGVTVTPDTIGA